MLWSVAAPLIGSGIKALGGGILGLGAKKPSVPQYEIPSQYLEQESRARRMAAEGMPYVEELYGQMQESQATTLGSVERAATSSQDVLGAIGGVHQRNLAQLNQISQQSANYQLGLEQNLTQAQNKVAEAKDRQFQYQMGEYLRNYENYQSRMSQAFGGMFGGLSEGLNAVGTYYGNVDYANKLKQMNVLGLPTQ